jgi:predicted nucleic acid-binding protein
MIGLCFVDTNVFVYARDASEPEKQARARQWVETLWKSRCGRTGIQVLNEYYVAVTQKLDPGLEADEAWQDVEDLLAWNPTIVDAALMNRGRDVVDRFSLSWWDALIVAAAQASNCRYLLTEDLQDGQKMDGTQILNPFRITPQDFMAEARVADEQG